MSATIQVFLKSSRVPTVDDWNAAIKAAGFDLVLDSFDLRADDCYRPATLQGRESGFEWFLLTVGQVNAGSEFPGPARVGDCDLKADLGFTSYADEDVSAGIAAAVLTAMTGGYYVNSEEGTQFLRGEEALAAARKLVLEWQRRGPYQPETPPVIQPPPIIAAQPPPLPRAAVPLRPMNPKLMWCYRLGCGLFVLIYLGMLVNFILISRGTIDPSLDLTTEFLTAKNSAARAQAIAEERENAFGGGALCAVGALFYAAAAFVPRKPAGWTIGLIALVGMMFPFMITVALSIPLLIGWLKPETKRYFLKPI